MFFFFNSFSPASNSPSLPRPLLGVRTRTGPLQGGGEGGSFTVLARSSTAYDQVVPWWRVYGPCFNTCWRRCDVNMFIIYRGLGRVWGLGPPNNCSSLARGCCKPFTNCFVTTRNTCLTDLALFCFRLDWL